MQKKRKILANNIAIKLETSFELYEQKQFEQAEIIYKEIL